MKLIEVIKPYIKGQKRVYALLALLLGFTLILSFSTLTTKPRIWTDEAVSIEIAKNFAHNGTLDIQIAPDTYTGFPELLQSTGYPITVPLGILFKIFGDSFTLARLYMLLWTLSALYAVFCFTRSVTDSQLALFATLLVATFASFYASGQSVVGEIPGFLLLLASLYFAFEKRSFVFAGIFLGFAVVAKPSVFLLVVPALAFVLLREPRIFFRRTLSLAVGMLPSAVLWLSIVQDNIFLREFWSNLAAFYQNPYSSDISANISANLSGYFNSTTLVYFSLLALVLLVARFWVRRRELTFIYDFTLVYSILAFLYYLRSPGWLRYILIAELLILVLLPHALFTLLHVLQRRVTMFRTLRLATASAVCLCALALMQGVHMFTAADVYKSDASLRAAAELDATYSGKRILVLGDITLYSLLRNPDKEVVFDLTGMPQIGRNTLLGDKLPDVVVTGENRFKEEGTDVLSLEYELYKDIYGYDVFTRVR